MKEKQVIKFGAALMIGACLGTGIVGIESNFNQTNDVAIASSKLSKKKIKEFTDALNDDLADDSYGNTKWSWNKESESWEATLDPNSDLYQDMDEGNVALWNAYVREIKEASRTFKKNGWKDYSYFQVLDPDDTSKTFLQINKGKVKYDIGEDLGN